MITYILLSLMLFFCQLTSGSSADQGNLNDAMCPTDAQHPSSAEVRKWAFEFLKKGGHPHPEMITLINAQCNLQYHASARISSINFNESHYSNQPIGVKRATIGHEVAHIFDNIKIAQEYERKADLEGARLVDCHKCVQEMAEYYLKEHRPNATNNLSDITKKANLSWMPDTLPAFKQLESDEQSHYLKHAKEVSEKHFTTHPCRLERAYYLCRFAQTDLKDRICVPHQELKKQQRKHITLRLLEKAKEERQTFKGLKRNRDDQEQLAIETKTTQTDDEQAQKKQKP